MSSVLALILVLVLTALPHPSHTAPEPKPCQECTTEITALLHEATLGTMERALSLDLAFLVPATRTKESMRTVCRIPSVKCPVGCLEDQGWDKPLRRISLVCNNFAEYFVSLNPCMEYMTGQWKAQCKHLSDTTQALTKDVLAVHSGDIPGAVTTAKKLCSTVEDLVRCETNVYNSTCGSSSNSSSDKKGMDDDEALRQQNQERDNMMLRLLLQWRLSDHFQVIENASRRIGTDIPRGCARLVNVVKEFVEREPLPYPPAMGTPTEIRVKPPVETTTTVVRTTTKASTTTTTVQPVPTTEHAPTLTTVVQQPTTAAPDQPETETEETTNADGKAAAQIATKPNCGVNNRFNFAVIALFLGVLVVF